MTKSLCFTAFSWMDRKWDNCTKLHLSWVISNYPSYCLPSIRLSHLKDEWTYTTSPSFDSSPFSFVQHPLLSSIIISHVMAICNHGNFKMLCWSLCRYLAVTNAKSSQRNYLIKNCMETPNRIPLWLTSFQLMWLQQGSWYQILLQRKNVHKRCLIW